VVIDMHHDMHNPVNPLIGVIGIQTILAAARFIFATGEAKFLSPLYFSKPTRIEK